MGCFSQKGLCYSFEIFNGLLSNKNIRNPMKNIFGEYPLHPHLTLFLPEIGEIWRKSTLQTRVLRTEEQGPPSALAEIFRQACLQSGPQTSTPLAKNAYPKFQNPKTTFQMFTWQQFSNLTGQCTNLAPTNSSQRQRTHSALTNLFFPDYYSIIY